MMQKGLNNNGLKLIAMLAMTVDHVGVILLPEVTVLRLIGRLAFPIYAYMIAEGCRHTRSLPRYLGTVAAMAALCQIVYCFTMGSLRQNIFVTFSLAIGIVWLVRIAQEKKSVTAWAFTVTAVAAVFFLAEILPQLLAGTDFGVEYGFLGVMLPVGVYLCRTRRLKLLYTALVLIFMALHLWAGQWCALLALPLLVLYNGQRGRMNMKWLFYLYYPAHLAVIQGLAYLLSSP